MSKRLILIHIAIILFLILTLMGISFLPVEVNCAVPGQACLSEDKSSQYDFVYRDIEKQPFIGVLFESIFKKDFPIKYKEYKSGEIIQDCIGEGELIPVTVPRLKCCEGLKEIELTEEEKEWDGVSGKCVK